MNHKFTIQQGVGPELSIVLSEGLVLAIFAICKLPESPKVRAIKYLRDTIPELGLKEAKDIVLFIADNGAINADGYILLTYRKPTFIYEGTKEPVTVQASAAPGAGMITPVRGMKRIGSVNDGDLYDYGHWMATRRNGSIIASDGSGYWATATHYSHAHPVFNDQRLSSPDTDKPSWATHVMWFNK